MTDRPGGLHQALAFLTVAGGPAGAGPEAVFWFPAVGAVTGLGVGAVWWGAAHLWPPAVAAALAVAADLAVTGMLHLDGLCDSADGLLSHLTRERRLEVMAEPGIGAFGVGSAFAVLLLRWASLAAIRPSLLLVAALWSASRTWMAAAAVGVPYARPGGGLASAFLGDGPRRPVLVPVSIAGMAAALLLGIVWRPVVGPAAIGAGTIAAVAVVALAWRRLGGFTGDVLGAAGMVGETVGLLVASAKW